MLSFLALGFLIGLRHALEPDHVAAVLSVSAQQGRLRDHARSGMLWGIGHALTLLLLAGSCVMSGVLIPEDMGRMLEAAVGVMLVGLGISVFVRVRRGGIHFHSHVHDDGVVHFHAHAHPAQLAHPAGVTDPRSAHRHGHRRPAIGTVLIGAIHGLAGSAALVLLVASAARSPWSGLAYVALFGLGAIVGMMVLAATVALPVQISVRYRTGLHGLFCAAVGASSIFIGVSHVWVWLATGAV